MKFIIFGDSKGKQNGMNKEVLNSIMRDSSTLTPKVNFIVFCGDSVAGDYNTSILTHQLNDFISIIQRYHGETPIFPILGNHEVNITPIDDRYEKVFMKTYNSFIPDSNSLENYNKTVYYKDFENIRIIVLNTFHYNQVHTVPDDQLNWLLKITTNCTKKKLLFIHSPAFPTGAHLGHCLDLYPEKRDKFLKAVEKANIDIIFSGHEHNYSRRIINMNNSKECIYQVITGGGGEKLRNKYKSKFNVIVSPIAVYHYLIADVFNDYIQVTAKTIKGKVIDQFIIE